MSVILGVNGFPGVGHDAAAALLVDAQLVCAVEEERLSGLRHAPEVAPLRAVEEVLDVANIGIGDVDLIAYPWLPEVMGVDRLFVAEGLRNTFAGALGAPLCRVPPVDFVEHHVAHAWSGLLFLAPSSERRRVAVLVADGRGESTSGAAFVYQDGRLQKLWNMSERASLGIYYEALTRFVGFRWGQEGKTMGLAAFGRSHVPVPTISDGRFEGDGLPRGSTFGDDARSSYTHLCQGELRRFANTFPRGLTFNDRADLALSGQLEIERLVLEYVADLIDLPGVTDLVLSGGVALNCTINAVVAAECHRRQIGFVVPPPANDGGTALGAAVAFDASHGSVASVQEPYLGRPYAPEEIVRQLCRRALDVRAASVHDVADVIDKGVVGAWLLGGSEAGPRALGHRAIIARADSESIRDKVNFLKGREPWRPLAPSVTVREFERSFLGVPSAHMLITAGITNDAADRLAGVRHVDGTARPQVVTGDDAYLSLLRAVGERGGTEAILCTSLNQAGRPLAYSIDDALEAARAMGLGFLAGDGWMLRL